jgi:hypothetical protein
MSETEKKGSAWPWIAVPVAAVVIFFVLKECQHRLPPAGHGSAPSVPVPETPSSPKPGEPAPAGEQPETAPVPAPESEQSPAPQ